MANKKKSAKKKGDEVPDIPVTDKQIQKEKSLLKRIIPGWEWFAEKKFMKKKWKKEPFPSERSLLKEQHNLVAQEEKLKKLLKPIKTKKIKK